MSKYNLSLAEEELYVLDRLRRTSSSPDVRERASAILKVASGCSASEVARNGLLVPRRPQTVQDWVRNYLKDGLESLLIKKGRGRKPTFPPWS